VLEVYEEDDFMAPVVVEVVEARPAEEVVPALAHGSQPAQCRQRQERERTLHNLIRERAPWPIRTPPTPCRPSGCATSYQRRRRLSHSSEIEKQLLDQSSVESNGGGRERRWFVVRGRLEEEVKAVAICTSVKVEASRSARLRSCEPSPRGGARGTYT
jgi:hypothetical protein